MQTQQAMQFTEAANVFNAAVVNIFSRKSALQRLLDKWPDTPRENAMCMLRMRGFVTKINHDGKPYIPRVTERGYEFLRTGMLPDLIATLRAEGQRFVNREPSYALQG